MSGFEGMEERLDPSVKRIAEAFLHNIQDEID